MKKKFGDPLISVIVPTFNRSLLLKRTVDSILSQSFHDFELIVVDDGSTDATPQICMAIEDERVKYLRIENSRDIAKVRNTGLRNSIGKYIAFCDDDDLWNQSKLEKQVGFAKNYNFVCTGSKTIDHNDNIIEDYCNVEPGDPSHFGLCDLFMGNFVITSSVLVLKSELGSGFNETGSTNSAEDYEMWLKVASKNSIVKIEEPLVLFRKHMNTSTFDKGEVYAGLLNSVLNILSDYAKSADPEVQYYAKLGMIKRRKELINVYIDLRNYFKAACCYFSFLLSVMNFTFLISSFSKKWRRH